MKNKFKDDHGMPDPSCVYKFAWSTIRLSQKTTNSCYRVQLEPISVDNFDNFHNTPIKLSTRQEMLDGKWPGKGCEYCRDLEKAGGISDRMQANSHTDPPPELLKNNRSINVSPTIVEVYFNNLCNMSCIYCSAINSTTWENENRKFKLVTQEELDSYDKNKQDYPAILEKYWQWLEKNASSLREYYILGGEPFFQPEFEQNIEFFEKHPCPDLVVSVFSNLKVKNEKFKNILNKIQNLINSNHIKSFRLLSSIDSWGAQEEYVRYGLDLSQWEENFKTLVEQYPAIELVVKSTLCNLNIKSTVELFKKINEYNAYRVKSNNTLIKISCTLLKDPTHLQVDIFPNKFFDNDFEQIIKFAPTEFLKKQMKGFQTMINEHPYQPELVDKLKLELDAIDNRRNLNWKLTFPWLQEFTNNG